MMKAALTPDLLQDYLTGRLEPRCREIVERAAATDARARTIVCWLRETTGFYRDAMRETATVPGEWLRILEGAEASPPNRRRAPRESRD